MNVPFANGRSKTHLDCFLGFKRYGAYRLSIIAKGKTTNGEYYAALLKKLNDVINIKP